jgi:hypothetical protein
VAERITEISSLIGTFLFLSGRLTIHLHRFRRFGEDVGANHRFILSNRNISVPIGAIITAFELISQKERDRLVNIWKYVIMLPYITSYI